MTLTADWYFWLVWGCWVASWALLFAGQDIRPIWGILGALLLIPIVVIGASGDGKTWRALFLGVAIVFVLTVFRFVLSRLSLRLHEALIVRDLAAAGIDPTPIRRGFLKALRDY